MVEEARQQEVFFCDDTPAERRVLASFLYHANLSYRRIGPFVDRLYEAISGFIGPNTSSNRTAGPVKKSPSMRQNLRYTA